MAQERGDANSDDDEWRDPHAGRPTRPPPMRPEVADTGDIAPGPSIPIVSSIWNFGADSRSSTPVSRSGSVRGQSFSIPGSSGCETPPTSIPQCRSLLPPIPPCVGLALQEHTLHSLITNHSQLPTSPLINQSLNTPPNSRTGQKRGAPAPEDRDHEQYDQDDVDQDEARRLRKAERNNKHTRHYHYHDDGDLVDAVKLTCDLLKVYYSTINPFLTTEERKSILQKTYKDALKQRKLSLEDYPYGADEAELLGYEESNIRGALKKIVMSKIVKQYDILCTAQTPADLKKNEWRVAFLLEGDEDGKSVFHFADPEGQAGVFQNPIIADVVHEMWFRHHTDLGCLYQKEFDPIPNPLIALVLTTVWQAVAFAVSLA
ncbi:hypothetical protein JAAARDRAFT_197113 [Jaapia argillacea MUCL 33604]|uniref:DUF6532 domain-containing protein n=1 Tax=Jaapia argillacea MUCL 33604 TaxID=933084 RepID=A0A067PTH9_9AGAM|nr:hypothetical protein JAAARDRAFT_197113 [Jaapia argillacea MUCL 33604]